MLPSRDDPFVRAVSAAIGGPPGRHARLHERRFWLPVRVLVAITVFVGALGWANKSLCATHGYTHEYQYTRLCYTDVLALWYAEGLDQGKIPILDNVTPTPGPDGVVHHKYVEYPVMIGALMAVAEGATHLLVHPTGTESRAIAAGAQPGAGQEARNGAVGAQNAFTTRRAEFFFDTTAAILLAFAVAAVVLTGLTAGRRRIWDAALFGAAPALALHADVNWDLAAVAFTAGALYAWSRRAPATAGVLLGLGVATKFYPLLLLVPLLALCLRAGRLRALGRLLAAAVAAWLVVDVPVWLANPAGFGRFYAFNAARGTEYNSLFYAVQYALFGQNHFWDQADQAAGRPPFWLNTWSALLLGLALLGIALLAVSAPRRPRLGQLAFLTVLAFVLTNKVYSPQYALWLLPMVALARPRWRAWLVWQGTEVALLVLLYAHLIYADTAGGTQRGVAYPWFFFLGDLPRDAALLTLAGLVVREIRRPELDAVRGGEAGGVDDPAGGVLDGAPDRWVLGGAGQPAAGAGTPSRSRTSAMSAP